MTAVDHGHRTVPHTADLRIEAWGRTREECVAQAVLALVESFADPGPAPAGRLAQWHLAARPDPDLVAAAMEEVIYRLDTEGVIPASVQARQATDSGVVLTAWVVDVSTVPLTGAVPKAVSLSGLACGPDADGIWRSSVTVDV